MRRDTRRLFPVILAVACGLLPVAGHGAPPSVMRDPRFSPDGRQIALSSNRDGNLEIYIVKADGSGLRRVTDDPAMDGAPEWSPDGKSLAFHSNRDGNLEVYTIDVDGSNVRRWSDDPGLDLSPTWSRDGTSLFYPSDRKGGQLRAVVLATGADSIYATGLEHHNPIAFSPDGSQVAGVVQDGENWEIAIMNPEVESRRILAAHPSRDSSPAWSPTGGRIVFSSRRGDADWDIYVVDLDGENLTRLTTHEGRDFTPEWLPDGSAILFASNRDGGFHLYTIKPDGSDLREFPLVP
jgi:TolB protein